MVLQEQVMARGGRALTANAAGSQTGGLAGSGCIIITEYA